MPLTELVRHLNDRHRSANPERGTAYLYDGKTVMACYGGRLLLSRFLPIYAHGGAATLPWGHYAEVLGKGEGQVADLDWNGLFELSHGRGGDVYLDRLIRTLHTLNYLTFAGSGRLLLPVHHRHLLGVSRDHGLAFEQILRACGLAPERITLELDVASVPPEQLLLAVDNYRRRGYGIGLHYQPERLKAGLLAALRPDLLRLPPAAPPSQVEALAARAQAWGGQVRLLSDVGGQLSAWDGSAQLKAVARKEEQAA